MNKPRRGRRPSLTREQIVERAMALLARPGSEPLTLRAVARECGVAVGGLYRYFESLGDLEDQIAAGLLLQIKPLDAAHGPVLREQLVELGLELVRMYRLHPRLNQAFGPLSAASVGRATRHVIQVLLDAGISLERAYTFYAMLFALAYDWGTRESRMRPPKPRPKEQRILKEHLGEIAPQIDRMLERYDDPVAYRRWLLLQYIDTFLPELAKRRRRV